MAGLNAAAIEAWNTIVFEKCTRFRHVVTDGLAVHGRVAMDRVAVTFGARVLDVACGFGDTTCFFANPVQALRNIRRSIAPDGSLCMVVWRTCEDNVWLYAAERAARAAVPELGPRDEHAVTCGPGPFRWPAPTSSASSSSPLGSI